MSNVTKKGKGAIPKATTPQTSQVVQNPTLQRSTSTSSQVDNTIQLGDNTVDLTQTFLETTSSDQPSLTDPTDTSIHDFTPTPMYSGLPSGQTDLSTIFSSTIQSEATGQPPETEISPVGDKKRQSLESSDLLILLQTIQQQIADSKEATHKKIEATQKQIVESKEETQKKIQESQNQTQRNISAEIERTRQQLTQEIIDIRTEVSNIDLDLKEFKKDIGQKHEQTSKETQKQIHLLQKQIETNKNDTENKFTEFKEQQMAEFKNIKTDITAIKTSYTTVRRELEAANKKQTELTERQQTIENDLETFKNSTTTDLQAIITTNIEIQNNIASQAERITCLEQSAYSGAVNPVNFDTRVLNDSLIRDKILSTIGTFSGNFQTDPNPKEIIKAIKTVYDLQPIPWDKFKVLISGLFTDSAKEWYFFHEFLSFSEFSKEFLNYYWNYSRQHKVLSEILDNQNNFSRSDKTLSAYALHLKHQNQYLDHPISQEALISCIIGKLPNQIQAFLTYPAVKDFSDLEKRLQNLETIYQCREFTNQPKMNVQPKVQFNTTPPQNFNFNSRYDNNPGQFNSPAPFKPQGRPYTYQRDFYPRNHNNSNNNNFNQSRPSNFNESNVAPQYNRNRNNNFNRNSPDSPGPKNIRAVRKFETSANPKENSTMRRFRAEDPTRKARSTEDLTSRARSPAPSVRQRRYSRQEDNDIKTQERTTNRF